MSSIRRYLYQVFVGLKVLLVVLVVDVLEMSLKRPSYFFRMVFLVLMYRGRPFIRAIWKLALTKPEIDSLVLY